MHKFIIRTDSSFQIGTGHVMRCLTLASALRDKASEVSFVCREHEGNLIKKIRNEGFKVFVLPVSSSFNPNSSLAHAHWLGEDWEVDAEQTVEILKKVSADFLVVDHYALDINWEARMRSSVSKILVIDDLADREHDSDFLLDQTFGRNRTDYEKLVPVTCRLLLGSRYALLRPEFSEWREKSLARRGKPEFKTVLISFGGADPKGLTELILKAIIQSSRFRDFNITVVMGASSPRVDFVRKMVSQVDLSIDIRCDVDNMAELMSLSDLSFGALGGTSWERCCLGLPSYCTILADNQKKIASELNEAKAVKIFDILNAKEIIDRISVEELIDMSRNASLLVDGLGTSRVSREIIN